METKISLSHLQVPVIFPYPDPIQPIPCPQTTSWIRILILSAYLRLGFPSSHFPLGFPTKTMYTRLFPLIRTTCTALTSRIFDVLIFAILTPLSLISWSGI